MKSKKRLKKPIVIFLLGLCAIGFLTSLVQIIKWLASNQANDVLQTELKKKYVIKVPSQKTNKSPKPPEIKIDLDGLKSQNEDTVAYLKVPNTKIDYVVVKGKDNDFYLKHNFDKKSNKAGWVFADYQNRFDGTDRNIVIYGHNMKNGSMFGTLKTALKKEWYQNPANHKIDLITETGVDTYQVFSIYSIKVEDYYITTNFLNDKEYETFLNTLKKRSYYNFKVELTPEDSILTLSSCRSKNERVVLHAKRVTKSN